MLVQPNEFVDCFIGFKIRVYVFDLLYIIVGDDREPHLADANQGQDVWVAFVEKDLEGLEWEFRIADGSSYIILL